MRLTLLLLTLFIALLSSCSRRLYYPDRVNSPAFNEAHELKAAATVKLQTGGIFLAPDADIAYAPLSHVGLIASYRSMPDRMVNLYSPYNTTQDNFNKTQTNLNGNRVEAGAGYFTRLGREGLFEVYGGYGNGLIAAAQAPYYYFDSRYHRFFVQADAGFKNRDVSVTGGIQASMQQYYQFHADSIVYRQVSSDPAQFVTLVGRNFVFVQPYINAEAGYKYVFFNFQYGLSGQLGSNKKDISGDAFMYLSMGITFHLDTGHWRKVHSLPEDATH
jgi:hypothetical protein